MGLVGTATGGSASESALRGVTRVRILIADEVPVSCENLRKVLQSQRRLEIVGEAHDVDSALKLMRLTSPHILLVDYALCRKLGERKVFERAEAEMPRPVVTLATAEKGDIVDSFRLGAKGIVLKNSPPRIWWRGIAAVLAGQYWLGNESLAVLVQAIRESPADTTGRTLARHFGLTPREIEIVQKIADGRSNKEVGKDCSIRERTVKHHLTNIFDKIGVSSRLELALFARDQQIFSSNHHGNSAEDDEQERGRKRTETLQGETLLNRFTSSDGTGQQ